MAIIIRIQGGTGNQLFQYAFARGVASKLGVTFLIDRTVMDNTKYDPHKIHRKYSLDKFNTKIEFAPDKGFVAVRKHYKLFDTFYKYLRMKRFFLPFYFPERTFAFDEEVFERKDGTYFDGDWQTEKYFKHIEDEIRSEITEATPLSYKNQGILDGIKKANAVSLHVRRGDYTTDPLAIVYHGTCDMSYYKRAMEHIEKHVENPHYFIFSDDYNWSVENFAFLGENYTCVQGTEGKDHEDMILMSNCKHHIISNSSFGWWAAWLNPNKEKIVVAPTVWFRNAPKANTTDIIPDRWVKL